VYTPSVDRALVADLNTHLFIKVLRSGDSKRTLLLYPKLYCRVTRFTAFFKDTTNWVLNLRVRVPSKKSESSCFQIYSSTGTQKSVLEYEYFLRNLLLKVVFSN